ncbi:hypothetical protein ACFWEO_29715 [Streptomyces roseolus]|uniref:hypothetical protein n=1 Tax=Streptomyces roseolus TaxID=67358 RepID=UPI003630A697
MGVFSKFRRKKQLTEEPGERASTELTDAGSESGSEAGSGPGAGGAVTRVAVPGPTAPAKSSTEASGAAEAAAEVVEIPRQQSAGTAADAASDTAGETGEAASDTAGETGEAART